MVNHINFVVNENKLKEMAYGDTVYAWLYYILIIIPTKITIIFTKKISLMNKLGEILGVLDRRYQNVLRSY